MVGSGKSQLLTFLAILISMIRGYFAIAINELEEGDFSLLISGCSLILEKSGISKMPTFPLFPQVWGLVLLEQDLN